MRALVRPGSASPIKGARKPRRTASPLCSRMQLRSGYLWLRAWPIADSPDCIGKAIQLSSHLARESIFQYWRELHLVDISKLPPSEVAGHFRNPAGSVGAAVGEFMNKNGEKVSLAAYAKLDASHGHEIVEIGVGNGAFAHHVLSLAPDINYSAVDISETMIEDAKLRNADLVQSGRASFVCASVEEMPFPKARLDRAVTVNSIYFWPNPLEALTMAGFPSGSSGLRSPPIDVSNRWRCCSFLRRSSISINFSMPS
jgi:hypothetical protein